MTLAYIGLGSNLGNDSGDSIHILQQAVQGIAALGTVKVSSLYGSKPMGPQDQPDYFNAVVALETNLGAAALFAKLQQLEQQAGRIRMRRWGERTLDLDLLLFGTQSIQSSDLTVPHVGILQRSFVVLPLLDLDDQLHVNGVALKTCAVANTCDDIHKIANSSWVLNR